MRTATGGVAASCFVAVAILLLSWTTYFAQLNFTAYDFMLRAAGAILPESPTVIVAIDEDSLDRVGAWPWSREKLAELIRRVESHEPRVIAVDLLLDDYTNEQADMALADAIRSAKAIVLPARIDPIDGIDRWRRPIPPFMHEHVRVGHVHADPDFDGISRRVFSAKAAEGSVVRAFAIVALASAGFPVEGDLERQTEGVTILRPQPVNIRFVGDNKSFPHIPAWQVLENGIAADALRDRIVLVGSTAEGLGDQWFTPFAEAGRRMSGVEIHANAIETLFASRAVGEAAELTTLLALAAVVTLLWWVHERFEGWRFYMAAIVMSAAVVGVSLWMMKYANVWIPFPPFLMAIGLAVPALAISNIVRVNRDLDKKLERLSMATLDEHRRSGGDRPVPKGDIRKRILKDLPEGGERDTWLTALDRYDSESEGRVHKRRNVLGALRYNSQWKLDAVDYFNEELARFLAFNSAILASIEDVIVVSDPAGRVLYQNPAAKRLAGYSGDPGFAPDYFSSLLDSRDFIFHFATVLSAQQPVTLSQVAACDGKSFYTVSLSPISRAGLVMCLHDATAQYALNQAKNDMVSLVSHELRTPLTSIRGYSDMLLKYNLVEEKGRQFLATIVDESKRLNQLIQSFLDIAYIESGRQKVTKSGFEAASVIRDIVNLVRPVAAEKQIDIEAPSELSGAQVLGDRLLIFQALTNLVTNAIKYSPPGTTVTIAFANGSGRARFRVADRGFGIPADELSRIFEKFYRRGNKETREQSGFGLGLAFVKEVAMRHGGDVIVESEVGQGSVFTLWLPN